ncbi:alpha/beta hydrolase [Lactobacillus paragasseri]|uniref:Alpha/beta hydrolase n=1 Tax=Lactobacillus paragasseri TaxID=2107999 RepID=A0ABD4ZZW3_9LACO|nr:alpha/beta hydrolase [Lactobacillus paragasseri]MDK7952434.1 alpha/beta hydrolase [Lactobacillus paragasseri]MDO6361089.1 alpha/beta hydrolase [Lactobacillus paragasseri]MDX5058944.1 alpha/beta hydrolase [Lactobacillus paragasseri]
MRYFSQKINSPLSEKAVLDCYIQNTEKCAQGRKRPAIIICPGGGYEEIADREGEPIAIKMMSYGFQSFVLNYSLTPAHFPIALTELSTAIEYVRKNAKEFHIDPDAIWVAGFSAGGHLVASLGVYWHTDFLQKYGYQAEEIKPNGLLLGYPVITAGKYAHRGSIVNLLGKDKANEIEYLNEVSLELHVDRFTPPSFIWHTATDDVVPVNNSLMFANALKQNDVKFALTIYPEGGHGLSLGTIETAHKSGHDIVPCVTNWPEKFVEFARDIGDTFLKEKK